MIKAFKKITALAVAAVTAGALGLSAFAGGTDARGERAHHGKQCERRGHGNTKAAAERTKIRR